MKFCLRRKVFFVGLILPLLIIGCSNPTPEPVTVTRIVTRVVVEEDTIEVNPVQRCTLKGCSNSLFIELEGKLPPDFSVTADFRYGTENMRISAQCSDSHWTGSDDACRSLRIMEIPQELTVSVTWEEDATTQTFNPVYRAYLPNGPGCEPACKIGSVTMDIP